jgi:ribosomal protein S27AE
MTYRCPGADNIRTPSLKTKICPDCGNDIDLFSHEARGVCDKCGFVAYNDALSCLKWCAHARECVGDEVYERYLKDNAPPAS